MPLILYPIILIVAVIIFYILGKKNGAEKEIIKTVTQYNNEPISLYHDETEDQFHLRCHNFITDWFTKNELRHHTSNDYKSTVLTFEAEDGVVYNINIESYYNGGNRYIMLFTKINDNAVPSNKLTEVSELINRLNNALILSTLQFNYENRAIESILIYRIGNEPLLPEHFAFYYSSLVRSRQTKAAFNRIINNNEEPALVTIDYLSQ